MGTATFSANGNYYIDVDAALVSQNIGGNYSTIYWRVNVVKTNGSGFWASTNTGNSGSADANVGGLWSNGNMAYDFRNGSNTGTFLMADGSFNIGHDANGYASYIVNGSLNLVNLGSAGSGTGWRDLPRIPKVPGAPNPAGFGPITTTSIEYHFLGTTDNGATVLEWQALYQDATLNGPQIGYGSNGSTNLGGLIPGHLYNFWSRGRNSVGWGPWSAISSAKTLAAARVKIGGIWKYAVPYVKVGGVWKTAQPYVKSAGNWKKAT